jgi:hypothetical protein
MHVDEEHAPVPLANRDGELVDEHANQTLGRLVSVDQAVV